MRAQSEDDGSWNRLPELIGGTLAAPVEPGRRARAAGMSTPGQIGTATEPRHPAVEADLTQRHFPQRTVPFAVRKVTLAPASVTRRIGQGEIHVIRAVFLVSAAVRRSQYCPCIVGDCNP